MVVEYNFGEKSLRRYFLTGMLCCKRKPPRGENGKVGTDVKYYDVARIFCAWISAAVQKCVWMRPLSLR